MLESLADRLEHRVHRFLLEGGATAVTGDLGAEDLRGRAAESLESEAGDCRRDLGVLTLTDHRREEGDEAGGGEKGLDVLAVRSLVFAVGVHDVSPLSVLLVGLFARSVSVLPPRS